MLSKTTLISTYCTFLLVSKNAWAATLLLSNILLNMDSLLVNVFVLFFDTVAFLAFENLPGLQKY